MPISARGGFARGAGDAPESFGAAGDDGALAVEVERRVIADHVTPSSVAMTCDRGWPDDVEPRALRG